MSRKEELTTTVGHCYCRCSRHFRSCRSKSLKELLHRRLSEHELSVIHMVSAIMTFHGESNSLWGSINSDPNPITKACVIRSIYSVITNLSGVMLGLTQTLIQAPTYSIAFCFVDDQSGQSRSNAYGMNHSAQVPYS
jgi:hypothetical protein